MKKQITLPSYTLGEEIFNSVSHGIGALLSIAGCVVLIVFCAINNNAKAVVSASVFGASLIVLYTMSTLYHALTNPKAKRVFRVFDHDTIFLLIAGTYTPYALCCIKPVWLGWTIFGCIWASAVLGIVFSSVNLEKFSKFSTICYVLMGWAIIFAIKPLYQVLPKFSLIALIAGGLMYSLGVYFYKKKSVKYFHSIWHLFVVAGSVLHYFSVLYAIGF
ncbi:MAG: hemolysin III family protein [Oscillospiraceae bacterium]|nr:hemolysin III family protein [Oscillospiraceae bacterium]MDE6003944.1 hemolysin III family protein [Oscillospiraceae bacterium]MDE6657814.1 hemolysin III family protein [Oscillospiraceae bacterium]